MAPRKRRGKAPSPGGKRGKGQGAARRRGSTSAGSKARRGASGTAERARTAVIGAGVELGRGTVVQDWVEVGVNPAPEVPPTVVGPDAVLRSGTIVYRGVRIGARFQSGHRALVREGTVIGDDCSVGTNSILERDVVLEDEVRVHSGCFLPEYTVVRRGAWIGPCVIVTNVLHPPCPQFKMQGPDREARDFCVRGPLIEEDAKVGAGAILMPGIRVGAGALIGAGAVVGGDVPAGAVMAGNPARAVRTIPELVCHPGHYDRVYEWEEPRGPRRVGG